MALTEKDKLQLIKNLDNKISQEEKEKEEPQDVTSFENKMLQLAKEAYNSSTEFLRDFKIREWKDAYDLYHSKHTSESKFGRYVKKNVDYQHSQFFIPKIYEYVTTQKAQVRQALFTGSTLVDTQVFNEFDEEALLQADFSKAYLEELLKENNWWFRFAIGQYQEGELLNFIASKQCFDFETQKPVAKPISAERIRIHPQADEFDPANSSPYLIHLIPMYGYQIKKKMNTKNVEDKWTELDDDEIRKSIHQFENDVASARQGQTTSIDDSEGDTSLVDHQIFYVHENFIRDEDGIDYCFYTLGPDKLLSKIYKTSDIYFQNRRPIRIGNVMLEAGTVYPKSPVVHVKPLQEMLNELQNMSNDIKRTVAMPSFLISKKVHDLYALENRKPGSFIKVTNPQTDIAPLNPNTQVHSLQAEILTAATHIDDSLGRYGISTAQSGAGANASVGGMQQQASSANLISELKLATYVETYLEGVLQDLWEIFILYNGQDKKNIKRIFKDYGIADKNNLKEEDALTKLGKMDKVVKIGLNVAIGAGNPDLKFQKIISTLSAISKLSSESNPNMPFNMIKIGTEALAIQGYRNPSNFFDKNVDPEKEQLKQEVQQLQQQLSVTKEANPRYVEAEISILEATAQEKLANIDIKREEVELKKAQTGLALNKAVESGVQATYGAVQAATELAIHQEAAPIADHLLASSKDPSGQAQAQSQLPQALPGQTFTPQEPMITPEVSQQMADAPSNTVNPEGLDSAFEGFNKGIEKKGTE